MRNTILSLAALTALAACGGQSGPAPTTATSGPGSPPLQQEIYRQPHSTNAGAGTATISGGDTQGRPQVTRDGTTAGPGVGGVPEDYRPMRNRSNKGG
ncbi:hypothetical protein JMJ56_03240 [Belnapia sp. T18]|uniref:Lipoprotein n=1 Tax=Belnapia arida TaxID=2804533 RepID=A0ABS1TYR9_9PROT|nr:hypothetical protein [Belnapia arida]MBL6077005.1 hypothetical protein [Belnapia arida]